jgi:very-short-patch-repair endonuclease
MTTFKPYDTIWKEKSLFPFWDLPRNNELETKAKKLRKSGILPEVLFWNTFKDKKKLGFDLDRQVIIGNYIVDFFIPELGLIFEIDGSIHNFKVEYDEKRDNYLKNLGLKVVHILDGDIKINMDFVYKFCN